MAANLANTIDVKQLCAATRVSKKTLETIFRDYVGVTPLDFIKIRRLQQVYKALVRANPSRITVADIARAWGFHRLDIFTNQFKELFGRSPLEVLRQTNAGILTGSMRSLSPWLLS